MQLSSRFKYFYPTINNCQQFVAISNGEVNLPVLLILHGGPGMVLSPILDSVFRNLETKFRLVIWDQRGAGLSFNKNISETSMTLEQLVKDTKQIVLWLKEEVVYSKLYVLGHSYGATLGIYTVNKYPELFSGFISVGQWLINSEATTQTKISRVEKIISQNPKLKLHQSDIILKVLSDNYWLDDILNEYGYEPKVATDTWEYQMNLIQNSSLYDKDDKQKYADGMSFSEHLYNEIVTNYNVVRDIQSLKVKSLFIVGSSDLITPYEPVKDFVNNISMNSTPQPRFKILDGLRHYLFMENPDHFSSILEDWC
jgi:pimeloyl-ACP methyl ester carboxylesterase